MHYKQAESYTGMAMEVAVDRARGKVTVRRVACAHDCGLIMNPDGLLNQIEGNIMQALSRTLHEEVTFDGTHVTSVDWSSYPILRFPEAPAIQVALLDHPDQPPFGAGEAAGTPSRRRWRTPSSTRPAFVCELCRSPRCVSAPRSARSVDDPSKRRPQAILEGRAECLGTFK